MNTLWPPGVNMSGVEAIAFRACIQQGNHNNTMLLDRALHEANYALACLETKVLGALKGEKECDTDLLLPGLRTMFEIRFRRWPGSLRNPYITTDWQWLIRLAWGPRRVSSKAPAGTPAYPESVGAGLGLWIAWYKESRRRKIPYVVVVRDGADHGGEYVELLLAREAEAAKEARRKEIERNLAAMQSEREQARQRGDFARADEIRAQIEAVGITVHDSKIRGETK